MFKFEVMTSKKIEINYELLVINEINADNIRSLFQTTKETIKNAYAPYSQFKVSAGVLLSNNKTVFGVNVENASYPVSICAERNVISTVVAKYPNEKIKAMAIFADKAGERGVPPCGLCRQTLVEIETKQKSKIDIYLLTGGDKVVRFYSASDLLPYGFNEGFL